LALKTRIITFIVIAAIAVVVGTSIFHWKLITSGADWNIISLVVSISIGTSGVSAYVLWYMQHRAVQRQAALRYLSRFLLTKDFLEYLGGFSVMQYLLHAMNSLILGLEHPVKIFDPTSEGSAKSVRIEKIEELQQIIAKVKADQERRNLEILKSGRFIFWPSNILPLIMKANDLIDDVLENKAPSVTQVCLIADALVEMEDKIRKIFGMTQLE